MRVIVDEAAWNDLDKIGSWIAEDSPEAARYARQFAMLQTRTDIAEREQKKTH